MADTAELERQIAEKDRALAELRQQLGEEVAKLKQLARVTTMLNSTLNLDELLQSIMSASADLLDAETASLMLVDEETGELIIEVATGQPGEEVVKRRVPPGHGIAGWVVQNAKPLVIDNPGEDSRFYDQLDKATGFETRNMLAVPLLVKDRPIGVTEIINKRGSGFSERDVELAEVLASQASVAIDNARLYARLADAVVTARMSYRL
jgi:sigma-B regulation protein RsbU (phosphoserine phosphatase)